MLYGQFARQTKELGNQDPKVRNRRLDVCYPRASHSN